MYIYMYKFEIFISRGGGGSLPYLPNGELAAGNPQAPPVGQVS